MGVSCLKEFCHAQGDQGHEVLQEELAPVVSSSEVELTQALTERETIDGLPTATIPTLELNRQAPAQFQSIANHVEIDSYFSRQMLDFQNRQTDKQLLLLCDQPGNGCFPNLKLGAQFRASFLAAGTTGNSQFPYLGRFPADFQGTSATDARLLHANIAAAAHFTPWAHGYFETLFSDVFTFPTFNQGSYQVRQAFVAFGDPQRSPLYAFIGKKNVSFGDMGTLSPFSQSVVWHYFGSLAEGMGVGINPGPLNLSATALNGSRGIRVVDSRQKGQLNNFATNASYTRWLSRQNSYLRVGAGFLHGTIYNARRAEHIDPTLFGPDNAAWDINAHLRWGRLQLAGEYVSTVDNWPLTDHRVIAYRVEASADTFVFRVPSRFSASWSEGIQGPTGSQFEYNQQLVLGMAWYCSPNTQFSFEYVQSLGFAPLINLTTVSDRSVRQHSAVFGFVLVL